MVTANDVVKFFALNPNRREPLTNMRANKLAFYAQAWSIIRLGRPLFSDKIEAWQHGPVAPSVYHEYSRLGSDPLPQPTDLSFLEKFTEEECQLLTDVSREYASMTTWGLRNATHAEGTPWKKVYVPCTKNEIPLDLIRQCFEILEPLPELDPFASIPVADALPADYNDESWEDCAPR